MIKLFLIILHKFIFLSIRIKYSNKTLTPDLNKILNQFLTQLREFNKIYDRNV
jgi:hypothetical protein